MSLDPFGELLRQRRTNDAEPPLLSSCVLFAVDVKCADVSNRRGRSEPSPGHLRQHTEAGPAPALAERPACRQQRDPERSRRRTSDSAPVGHRVIGVLADRSAAGLFTSPRSAATTPQRLMTSFAKQGSLCPSTRRRHDFLCGSTRPRRKPRRSGPAGDKPDARSAPASASRLGCSMRKAAVAHDGDTRLLGGCFRLSRSPRPER